MFKVASTLIVILGIFSGLLLIFSYRSFELKIYDHNNHDKHRMILVVLDAFRHDYLEIAESRGINLTALKTIEKNGARVKKMTPVFPSVTMPNHQTLVTGLFSSYHGITYNTFNDSSFNYDRFAMQNQTSLNEERWYKGYPDPIWVTCEKHKFCKSGSMLWPNTDAIVNGYRPFRKVDQYYALNEKPYIYPYDRRVDEVLEWVKQDLVDFTLLYFDEPDATSHKYGPTHENTLNKIGEMDTWINRLLKGIENLGLKSHVDVIVTADHGMTDLNQSRVIDIDKVVDPKLYKSTYSYPIGIIYPNEGEEEKVYQLYKNASKNIEVFWRNEIPDQYNYKGNPNRISPIVTIVKNGWVVNSSHYYVKMKGGNHGYSQFEDDMKAMFLAYGPSFKHVSIDSVNNVDVYPLMMHLLGMKPNPNNGSSNLFSILTESAKQFKPRDNRWQYNKPMVFTILLLVLQTLSCLAYVICLLCRRFNRQLNFRQNRKETPLHLDMEHREALIDNS